MGLEKEAFTVIPSGVVQTPSENAGESFEGLMCCKEASRTFQTLAELTSVMVKHLGGAFQFCFAEQLLAAEVARLGLEKEAFTVILKPSTLECRPQTLDPKP